MMYMRGHEQASWTDERVAILKKLCADGLSGEKIARELGGGLTRSAVLGKIHRLKLNVTEFEWTSEREDLLKKLWEEGWSGSQIAVRIGNGCTRAAVIGKTHRLKLARRKRRTELNSATQSHQRKRTIRANGAGFVELDAEQVKEIASLQELEATPAPKEFLGISFFDLSPLSERPGHCRYPRIVDGQTLYCGQPRIEDSSYCRHCHKICHSQAQPISEQEREIRRLRARMSTDMRRAGDWVEATA